MSATVAVTVLGAAIAAIGRMLHCARIVFLTAYFLLYFTTVPVQAQNDFTLSLDPINKQNVSVQFFRSNGVSTEKPGDGELRDMPEAQTIQHKFTLYADLKQVGPNKYFNLFLYTFYAHDSASPITQGWYRFDIKAQPGNFADSRETVHFTLQHRNNSDDGNIVIPLHSFGDQRLVDVALSDSPVHVHLSSGDDIQLNVGNLVANLGVTIADSAQLILDNPALWETPAGTVQVSGAKMLTESGRSTISIHMVPRNWAALLATLSPFRPDKSQDTIKLILNCVADEGGVSKRIPSMSIPVRFEPPLLSLFLAITVGSVIATLLGQLLPGAWRSRRAILRQLAVAWGIALVVEVFAMFLVQLGSKLVLFTFELDPWQVLPALFIGFFASGGKNVLDYAGATKPSNGTGMNANRDNASTNNKAPDATPGGIHG